MGRDMLERTRQEDHQSFNPRARMGRDKIQRKRDGFFTVSTHAPAWGATIPTVIGSVATAGFTPRARMGRDAASAHLR